MCRSVLLRPVTGNFTRAGIGTPGTKAQNTSVYLTGLPSDVTQAKIGKHVYM